MMTHRPIIGITMGDPAGVGPEIIATTLADAAISQYCRPLVLGDAGILSHAIATGAFITEREMSLNVIEHPQDASGRPNTIDLMPISRLDADSVRPGQPTLDGGKAMVDAIFKAVSLAQEGAIAAIVTCPISKKLMHQAGCHFDGHTELLAHLTGASDYVMMLAGKRLRVALVTIHCALAEVPHILKRDRVTRTITVTEEALRCDFGIKAPRLAVAALNPHAGESGCFGSEEGTIIAPAVQAARKSRVRVDGPLPADTLFHKAASGQYDAVIAMYHDQGLIPLKLLHFSDGVNITLGLPIIRTSVDHGTAYDIAGRGLADPSSLKNAIKMASKLAENRARSKSNQAGNSTEKTP